MSSTRRSRGVELEQVGDVAVVRFTVNDLLEDALIRSVGQHLGRLVEEPAYCRMVVDLGAVERMSSAMFGQLLNVWRKVHKANGRMVLCCARSSVAEAIGILRLNDVIPLYDKEQDALQSF
jgi:anti-anti-sigma factor